jgi:DNA polymerase-3 subunit gamma/tau
VTYIGPRFFALAFGVVCALFLAGYVVLDRVASTFESTDPTAMRTDAVSVPPMSPAPTAALASPRPKIVANAPRAAAVTATAIAPVTAANRFATAPAPVTATAEATAPARAAAAPATAIAPVRAAVPATAVAAVRAGGPAATVTLVKTVAPVRVPVASARPDAPARYLKHVAATSSVSVRNTARKPARAPESAPVAQPRSRPSTSPVAVAAGRSPIARPASPTRAKTVKPGLDLVGRPERADGGILIPVGRGGGGTDAPAPRDSILVPVKAPRGRT